MKKELRSLPITFAATTLTGTTINFSNQSGHPSVVSFFATWCGPCNEQQKAVQRFIDKFGIDFPVAIDTDGSVFKMFAFHAIPSSAFYNANGVVTCLVQDSLEPKQIDNEASAAVGGWMP